MQSRAELPVTVVAASGCAVPPEIVLGIRSEAERSPNGPVMPHAEMYASVSLDLERPMDVGRFAEALASPELGLVRAKGFVRSADGKVNSLQVVGRRWTATKAMRHALWRVVCIGAKPEFDPQERRRIVSHHVL